MPTLINTVAQQPEPGATISLFRLDTSSLGGAVHYFCQSRQVSGPVVFGGQQYEAVDVQFRDLETNGQGGAPVPRVEVANTDGLFQAIVNTYGDLVGCTVERIRTFERFLDGQLDADPNAFFGPDIFRVERKMSETPISIEWELSASIDQEGKLLPGRLVIRDTCLWRYRRWNAGSATFNYGKAQCPYTGSNYFTASGVATLDGAEDRCGRKIPDCKLRFGENAPLPFGGFPGVGRLRK